jgi:hypothetical protein
VNVVNGITTEIEQTAAELTTLIEQHNNELTTEIEQSTDQITMLVEETGESINSNVSKVSVSALFGLPMCVLFYFINLLSTTLTLEALSPFINDTPLDI